MSKPATDEIIQVKAALVLRCYPTLGVTMQDLVDITIEMCQDDGCKPRAAQVKRAIKAMNPARMGQRYFLRPRVAQQPKIDLVPEALFARRGVENEIPAT